jgi:hypothetical protein
MESPSRAYSSKESRSRGFFNHKMTPVKDAATLSEEPMASSAMHAPKGVHCSLVLSEHDESLLEGARVYEGKAHLEDAAAQATAQVRTRPIRHESLYLIASLASSRTAVAQKSISLQSGVSQLAERLSW